MKKVLLIALTFLSIFLIPKSSKATHIMGGEVTWECLTDGRYVFTFKVYRDCSGASNSNPANNYAIHNTATGIVTPLQVNTSLSQGNEIGPTCKPGGISYSCAADDPEVVFESIRVMQPIRLLGTPPPNGWVVTYDEGNRNANDNLLNGDQDGITIRAKIFNHSGTVADTCLDNSPQFREKATSLLCLGSSFTYNHNATDDELDSLTYDWAKPLDDFAGSYNEALNRPREVLFSPNFSFTSPFPGTASDARNVPAVLDRSTGEITLTSFNSGKYVSVVKVTAYKCGEKVAEIYRELQSYIAANCSQNEKPIIRAPFQDGNGNFTSYRDTVRAGDLVSFNLQITDFPGPNNPTPDSVFVDATGLQFGANFTSSTTGCPNPPCATLSAPLPDSGLFAPPNRVFTWQTDCNHVAFSDGCVSLENTYNFIIRAVDDACPIPAQNITTISITVLADSVIQSPIINCLDVLPNGNVELDWDITPDPTNSFSAWMIYSATDELGPFTLIDSVKTYTTTTYTDISANAQNERKFYYVRSRSGCKGSILNVVRDTVSTIFVQATTSPTSVDVSWNPVGFKSSILANPTYNVFRKYPTTSSFVFLQTTSSTSISDVFTVCEDDVEYRVEVSNAPGGCSPTSNDLAYTFEFPEPQTNFSFSPAAPCSGLPVSFTNLTTISGGTLTYLWNFGDGSPTTTVENPTHTYTVAGTYTISLKATSGNNCDSTFRLPITVGFPDADAGPDVAICPGGTVQIGGSPTSTTPVVTYAWNNGGSLTNASIANPIASPNTTTTYTVTVTDVNGCSQTDQVTVSVNPVPVADAGPDRNVCLNSSVQIGGSPTSSTPATYAWSPAISLDDATASNPNASPTVTTVYTVTVTSGVNCSSTDQMTVVVDGLPDADAGADRSICPSGSVQIGGSPTSTTPGVTYAWNGAATLNNAGIANPLASPNATRNYTVTVTDGNGCTSTDQMTVTVNTPGTADAGADLVICEGGSTVIGGAPTGPAGSSFVWSPAGDLNNATLSNPTADPIVTTTYTVTITDANGCTNTDQMTLTVTPTPNADAGADVTICETESTVIGGSPTSTTAGVSYSWSPSAGLNSTTAANPTATPTTTTTYTVTVTVGLNCTNTDQVTVTVNPQPDADAGLDQIICNGVPVQIGGAPTSSVAGATFAWNNSASLNDATIANPTANPSTTTTYTVTVTHPNGCTNTDDVLVTVNSNPFADAGADQTICEGEEARIGGSPAGSPGSTFSWSPAGSLNNATVARPRATPTVTTTYTVVVTSGVNCTATDQVTVTVNPNPDADAGADQTICNLQSIQIGGAPTSTTAGATFAWSNTGSLDDAALANPTADPVVTTIYTVTVSHPNGCTSTDQMTVNVNDLPIVDAGPDQFLCNGGSIGIGGTPTGPAGSSYAWDNALTLDNNTLANPTASPTVSTTYTVTVTDLNGCTSTDQVDVNVGTLPVADAGADVTICETENTVIGGSPTGIAGTSFAWDNAGTLDDATIANPTASPLATTTYTVTVTDGSGCSSTDQITVTVNPQPDADAGLDQIICNGVPVQIGGAPTSSVAGATFAWNNSASLNDATIANPTANPSTTTTYTVTVTHPNGCTNTDDVLVTVNSNPFADAGADQTICEGEEARIGGSPAGSPGSTFSWSPAGSLNNATVARPRATPTVTTTYTVVVTSGVNCTATDQVTVTVNPNPDADAGADQTICNLQSIQIGGAPTSTTAGATFAWSNAGSLDDAALANPTADPVVTTIYTVTVSHPNGCTSTDQMTVNVNDLPIVDAGPDQFLCNGGSIGIGGTPTGPAGSSYAWDNALTLDNNTLANPTASPTVSTTYTVTVTDLNGCTSTDQVDVNVGTLPVADAGADVTICETENTVIGGSPTGVAGTSFAWDNAGTLDDATIANPTASPLATTTYTVTVTDGSGCSSTDQITVTVNPQPDADAGLDQIICNGVPVQIGGAPTSSVAGATFAWNNSASLNDATIANPTANPSTTTTYTVTVTHPNGCTNTDDVLVTVNSNPFADAGADQTICEGEEARIGGSPAGSPGSTFSWSPAGSLNNATVARPRATPTVTTTYTVVVTSGVNCTATDQVTVTVNPNPDADAGADQTICNLQSIQIGGAPTSTTAGATFAWSNAGSLDDAALANPTADPVVTTIYTVTVSHPNGCTSTDQMTVNVNDLPIVDAGPDQFLCNGGSIGIGGTPTGPAGSSYAWDNALTLDNNTLANPTASPTVSTTYTVTVTDLNGCTSTDQVDVNVGTLPVADAGADVTICETENTVIGGSPTGVAGTSFAWDNAGTLDDATIANPTASPLATTTYTVTVTDGSGCSSTDQITVTVNPQPDADAGLDQIICNGVPVQIGGAPTSSVAGASFAWNNAASLNNATIANPTANPSTTTTYTVTVTHPNGCTNTDDVLVTVNGLPTADAGADQTICFGESTVIGGSPTGPIGSTFAWDNAASLDNATLSNPTADPVVTTLYEVTITDINGCSAIDQVLITVIPLPAADAGADQTICEGSSVQIGGAPTSGTPGATYTWDNAGSLDNATLANPTADPVVTTTYTVTVLHPNGCTATDDVTVLVNPAPLTNAGADQSICLNESIQIGGTPTGPAGSTYAWDNALTLDDNTLANPTADPTVTTSYTVTVTDLNGCTNTDNITITVNPLPTADAGLDQTICESEPATLGGSPTGPAGSTYAWDNALTLNNASDPNPIATPTVTITYEVTVTDVNGCTDVDQVIITVNPRPDADAGADQTICNLQSVQIGGAPTSTIAGATFAWDNAGSLDDAAIANPTADPGVTTTYTVTVTHPNGCTRTDDVIVNVNALPIADAGADQDICINGSTIIGGSPTGPAGSTYAWDNALTLDDITLANPTADPVVTTTYSVTVTDGNGCTAVDQTTVTVNPLPDADAGADQTICNLESVQIGGAPTSTIVGATFTWDNGATLDDATLANPTADPNVTTIYTVIVTDANGCTSTDQMTVTVNPLPDADAGADQTICNLESVQIGGSPTSTVAGVTYAWDNGVSLDNSGIANPTASPAVTTTYTVTVTDLNGCTNTDVVIITVNPLPTVDAGLDQTICESEPATLGGSPTGPAGATYAWDNALTLNNASDPNPIATPTVTTTYEVTVTDVNGCTDVDQVIITVNPRPDADAGADQTICNLQSVQIGGAPTSTIAGATFAWDNAGSLDDAAIANPTADPGITTTYTVTVTHPNGCTRTDDVIVNVNALPIADAGADQDICINGSTTIGGSPTGPAGSTYAWDNALTLDDITLANPTADPVVTTTYSVTVTDGNGCTAVDQTTVTVNPLPDADAGADQTICNLESVQIGGAPTSTIVGATFTWDNAASLDNATLANPTADPNVTTIYTVIVTDANGCTSTDQMTVTVNPLPDADAGADQTICNLESVQIGGSPTSTVTGVTYAWDNAALLDDEFSANPVVSSPTTTTFTVTVTDPNGCTNTDDVTVTVNPLPVADAGADQVICLLGLTQIGGTSTGAAPLSFEWDNAASLDDNTIQNPTATPTVTTIYSLTVTDGNGCTATDQMQITVNPLPVVDAGADQIICDEDTITIGLTNDPSLTYLWDNAGVIKDATVALPEVYPSVTTIFTVVVTDANGCTSSDQVEVTVNPLPEADFSIDSQCEGDFAAFTDLSTIVSGNIQSRTWDFGDMKGTSLLANPAYKYDAPGTYTVVLSVTSDEGCTDIITKDIEINALPVADAGADVALCFGETVQLGGDPAGPTGAVFAWSPGIDLSNVAIGNPIASPLSTTKYYLSVTDQNGCFNFDSVEVVVNPLPVVDAGVPSDTNLCVEESIQMNATGASSYNWLPVTYLDNSGISNPTSIPEKNIEYVVFGADANGCISTDTVRLNVFNLDFTPTDTNVCFGDSIALIPAIQGDETGITYNWTPLSGLSSGAERSPRASPLVSQEYKLQITNSAGCVDLDSVDVTVNLTANVDFEFVNSARCSGAALEIENTSTTTEDFVWKLNGQFVSDEMNPVIAINNDIDNTLTLIGSNQLCTDSIQKVIPSATFEEILQLKNANVFTPNGDGINDIFDPGFEGEFIGCADFRIFDRWGEKVFDSNIGQYGWDGRTLNGIRAPNGSYFYVIRLASKEIRGSVYLNR